MSDRSCAIGRTDDLEYEMPGVYLSILRKQIVSRCTRFRFINFFLFCQLVYFQKPSFPPTEQLHSTFNFPLDMSLAKERARLSCGICCSLDIVYFEQPYLLSKVPLNHHSSKVFSALKKMLFLEVF